MAYNDSEPTSSHVRNTSQILVLSLGLTHKHSSITCSTSSLIFFQLSFNLSFIHCFQECFISCSSMSSCKKTWKGTVWNTIELKRSISWKINNNNNNPTRMLNNKWEMYGNRVVPDQITYVILYRCYICLPSNTNTVYL